MARNDSIALGPSITMATSFFGAMNALGIAVLGEYVTRIYEQVRARPMYVIERTANLAEDSRQAGGCGERETRETA